MSLQIAEPLGANTLLHGRILDSDQPITVSRAGVHRLDAEQETQRYSVKASHIHLLILRPE